MQYSKPCSIQNRVVFKYCLLLRSLYLFQNYITTISQRTGAGNRLFFYNLRLLYRQGGTKYAGIR